MKANLFGLASLICAAGIWFYFEESPDGAVADSPAERFAEEVAGPGNTVVQRISELQPDNAYQAGWSDGSNDHLKLVMRSQSGNPRQLIRDFRETKLGTFQLMADRRERNGLSLGALSAYQRGWIEGFDSVTTR